MELPKRLSLSAQAAATIREAIRNGSWEQSVPSERRLCEMFQISRPTVRTALHLLEKEGLIEIRQGRRNRILRGAGQKAVARKRTVGILTHVPIAQMPLSTYQRISEMRAHLADHGFTAEIVVCQARSPRAQRRKLEDLTRENKIFCWVLLSASRELQAWFSEGSIPALLLGSCHPAIKLPSLDIDYRSVCRHAAGIFLGKGHRRLALVVPNSGVAGDVASEEGFREAVAARAQLDDARAIIVRHNGTAQHIALKLDALFNSDRPPTALLVAKPQHVFIVIIYLLKRGLSVPDTVSLIARDHDNFFANVLPPIAHYTPQEETFAHRLTRLMLQMVNQGYLATEPSLLFPRYFPGGTVRHLS